MSCPQHPLRALKKLDRHVSKRITAYLRDVERSKQVITDSIAEPLRLSLEEALLAMEDAYYELNDRDHVGGAGVWGAGSVTQPGGPVAAVPVDPFSRRRRG